jgi:folate-binding protein YgfZ
MSTGLEASWKDTLAAAGAQFGDWFGREEALLFGDARREALSLAEGVAVVDCSSRAQLELTGADRAALLHNLSTNQIRKLASGAGAEAFLLDNKGHTLFYVTIFAGEKAHVVDTMPGDGARLAAHLDRYVIREKVEIVDRSAEWAELLVAGPRADELLSGAATGTVPREQLAHNRVEIDGRKAWLRRVDWLAVPGVVVATVREHLPHVWSWLVERGAIPCGARALDAARIEAGTPLYGRDITSANLPQEVGRVAQTVSFTKGCYLGQETVARLDSMGHVNKSLVRLTLAGTQVPEPGSELLAPGQAEGQNAGHVTSAAFSERLGVAVALAYVRRGSNAPGTVLQSTAGAASISGA